MKSYHKLSWTVKSTVGILIIAFALRFPDFALAETRVSVQMGGMQGTSCEGATYDAVMTGSIGSITLMVWPIGDSKKSPFSGYPETKPPWLDLEFSYGPASTDEFAVSSMLYSLLNPTYYLDRRQKDTNKKWKRGKSFDDHEPESIYSRYRFMFRIPEELAGREICVRAALSPPPYGVVFVYRGPEDPMTACIQLVSPCSEEDESLVLASHIAHAEWSGNDARAIQLADSLIETGWRSRHGLYQARLSASLSKDYKACLRFIDVMSVLSLCKCLRNEGY